MPVIAIVGMHRSGTSCLTGCLENAGLVLGDVQRANPHNPRGNLEDRSIMELHDEVLQSSGGAWDDPPLRVTWSEDQLQRAAAFLPSDDESTVGFKDPRTLLTLSGWRSLVPKLALAGSFRHPARVVASLLARAPGSSEQKWFGLWATYNQILLAEYEQRPFPLVDFDATPTDYVHQFQKASAALALANVHPAFYEGSLIHQTDLPDIDLPANVALLHQDLLEIVNDA